jgi:glutathione S-transferase
MPFQAFPNIVRWIDGLMRIPAWADPWPAKSRAAVANTAGTAVT